MVVYCIHFCPSSINQSACDLNLVKNRRFMKRTLMLLQVKMRTHLKLREVKKRQSKNQKMLRRKK